MACAKLMALFAWVLILGTGCSTNMPGPSTTSTSSSPTSTPESTPALAPASPLPKFDNLVPGVKFVGNEACVTCHQEQLDSYELTAHRHALAEVKLAEEPAAGSYQHLVSKRNYEVVHDQARGRLVHRERLIDSSMPDLVQEHTIRYVIGSGHHSRSYLIEMDGFLVESPITWYTNQKMYAMSPGYDRPAHGSFERIADVNCLACHAGEVSAVDGNSFRPVIHQQTIGCESCHGAGAAHVGKHQSLSGSAESKANAKSVALGANAFDASIVNPRHLSREESESVCANCHLRGVAAVTLPGKSLTSFRPGMRLQDCRVDYQLAESDGGMKVVGHVEQMHLSSCYIKSDTLTCTTCHDPHSSVPQEQRRPVYIKQCLNCHASGCALPEDQRLSKVADNYCITCHMPQSATDIPHFAFTHHRIGVHSTEVAKEGQGNGTNVTQLLQAGQLVPVYPSTAPAALQTRNLGLAYFELADAEKSPQISATYLARSESMLMDAYGSPWRDSEVESVLARLSWERQDLSGALQLAESALRNSQASSRARLNSLFVLGEGRLQLQDLAGARQALEALVKERRLYTDWLLLTLCYSRAGQLDAAAQRLQQAIKINPIRREAHEMLIEIYKRQNKSDLVRHHQQLLSELPILK